MAVRVNWIALTQEKTLPKSVIQSQDLGDFLRARARGFLSLEFGECFVLGGEEDPYVYSVRDDQFYDEELFYQNRPSFADALAVAQQDASGALIAWMFRCKEAKSASFETVCGRAQ